MSKYDELINKSKFFKNFQKIQTVEYDSSSFVKLNIASGPNVFPFPNWINYDRADLTGYFNHIKRIAAGMSGKTPDQYNPEIVRNLELMPPHQRKVVDYLSKGGTIDFRSHDVRQGFSQHADNSVDLIYLGQMIEHLNPIFEVPKLLQECNRMLKPGGVIRITTPDLDILVDAYKNNQMEKFCKDQPDFYKNADPSEQLSYIMFGACGPKCTCDNYEGHMFLFTKNSMKKALEKASFKNVVFYNTAGLSQSPAMACEAMDEGVDHSIIAEAIK